MPVYKNEKKGTWYAKFNYKDWQGNTKQKKKEGFKKQSEAKEFEREFLNKAKHSNDMIFGSLVELYTEDCKNRLKPTTYRNKLSLINTQILNYFKAMPINEITPAFVRKWQNEIIAKNYSQAYIKTIHAQLSAIFNYAVKFYNLQSNPATLCGSIGKKINSIQFWTTGEFNTFISYVDDVIARVSFYILFYSGIRSGEFLALTLNDFDYENKTIKINKGYVRFKGEDLILEPKTIKSKRVVTMPDFIFEMVKEYVSKLYDYKPKERLFKIDRFYLSNRIKKYCKVSGIKKIRLHDLRHSHASLLIELGFSPLLISERLGHENIETTLQVYSHLYPNKHMEVANKLDQTYTDNSNNLDNIENI